MTPTNRAERDYVECPTCGQNLHLSPNAEDEIDQAVAAERERCRRVFIDEYADALRNGLDLEAAYRCGLAALRADAEAGR